VSSSIVVIADLDGTFARVPADRRVLFFGDSFVAGVGDPTGLGWVGRVVAASHEAGSPLTAYNLGVRRDTSADVAARWRAEAQARMRDAAASYGVVFGLGVNDTTEEDGRLRVAPGLAVDNLGRMIDGARAIDLDVLVVGPPPAGEPAQDDRVRDLSLRFADLAAQRGVPLVETFEALCTSRAWAREAAANDRSHPGAGGYAALAGIVLDGGWLRWIN
jgi:lysophospholipase L1-like esterase